MTLLAIFSINRGIQRLMKVVGAVLAARDAAKEFSRPFGERVRGLLLDENRA